MTPIAAPHGSCDSTLCDLDPYLEPWRGTINKRIRLFQERLAELEVSAGSLVAFASEYRRFGFSRTSGADGVFYREWAPSAVRAFVIGAFNSWNRESHPMRRNAYGEWEILIKEKIPHKSRIKVAFVTGSGEWIERISPWIRFTERNPDTQLLEGVYWDDSAESSFSCCFPSPKFDSPGAANDPLRIYEAHIGISNSDGRVSTFNEFTERMLPWIHRSGYNCIQLMAIMEHSYYASFGYQVTSFFAPSSRFGTPTDLKRLIDAAHELGLRVFLDVVHSHASRNCLDGVNEFDGCDHGLFHSGPRGHHSLWDSRCFDYGRRETLRFLLGNLWHWREEFHFDGFRFDGVTSMLYFHHGIGFSFSGSYSEYFGESSHVDEDACTYLMLANYLLHSVANPSVTIAEDVSGMPGMCVANVRGGGFGFDYRLAMSIPDMWIRLLKNVPDEQWNFGNIVYTLCDRRYGERTIAYCESHDQALVGDKTLAFWLMDAEMYTNMSLLSPATLVIERGMALHKLLRFITCALGGEGYLAFCGNEFGHPEWLDFPREGNGWSFHYARRQMHLATDSLLRYAQLHAFDVALMQESKNWLSAHPAYVTLVHEDDKVVVFDRGEQNWLFLFNFHSSKSYDGYRVPVRHCGSYRVRLNSDAIEFGGHGRLDKSVICGQRFFSSQDPDGTSFIRIYLPHRTALLLEHC